MRHQRIRECGLQQGDRVTLVTADHQHIHVVAVKTRGGYVRLEVDAPLDCGVWVRRARKGRQKEGGAAC